MLLLWCSLEAPYGLHRAVAMASARVLHFDIAMWGSQASDRKHPPCLFTIASSTEISNDATFPTAAVIRSSCSRGQVNGRIEIKIKIPSKTLQQYRNAP
jgi:hypothetical protein